MEITCKNCGVIDDYITIMKNGQNVATCNGCQKFIKNMPYQIPKFYIGKYKGQTISSCADLNYLKWFILNTNPKSTQKIAVESRIHFLEKGF